jgi:uncharacterized protein (DUF1778 family)
MRIWYGDRIKETVMTIRAASPPHAKPVNLRIREDVRTVIDRAAELHGKSRSDFMIDAAYRAAQDALLDQTLVVVDAESYRHYVAVLDLPPVGEGFEDLMDAPSPWRF